MTLEGTGVIHPWRRRRKTAILLAVCLGAWTWIYTYRRDAWKATLGLALQLGAISGTALMWIALRNYFTFLSQVGGGIPYELVNEVFNLFMVVFIIFGSCVFFGIQVWAIVDTAKAKVWELAEPKGRSKTAAILFAIFLSYMTWLYTYPKDSKKFWLGVAVVTVYPYLSYATWFNPFQVMGSQVLPMDYWWKSLALSVPSGAIWIIGIVLAAVRKQEWYRSCGQSTKPPPFPKGETKTTPTSSPPPA